MNPIPFHCAMFKFGKLIQHQYYTFSQSARQVQIEVKAISTGNDNTELECNFTFQPKGYSNVSIYVANDELTKHHIEFSQQQNSTSYVVTNSYTNDITELTTDDEYVLIDGLNPLFDFVNSVYLLGILDSERIEKKVFNLCWQTGLLQKCSYEYYRVANKIYITKNELDLTGELTLSEQNQALVEARYSNGEYYTLMYPS